MADQSTSEAVSPRFPCPPAKSYASVRSHTSVVHIVSVADSGVLRTPPHLAGQYARAVSDEAVPIRDLEAGKTAILCDSSGQITEKPLKQLAIDIERAGTTPALLVADAWKISSRFYKKALINALEREDPDVGKLLDGIVKCWVCGSGSSFRKQGKADGGSGDGGAKYSRGDGDRGQQGQPRRGNRGCNNGKGSVGADDSDSSSGSGSSDKKWVNIRRESFDVTATAYANFVATPSTFAWEVGSKEHEAAVTKLRRPLQAAFETELPGKWSGSKGGDFVLEDQAGLGSSSSSKDMSSKLFNALLEECFAALKVRQQRNQSGAHPLCSSHAPTRNEMFNLLCRTVTAQMPITNAFPNLAKASVSHVENAITKKNKKDSQVPATCKLEIVQL